MSKKRVRLVTLAAVAGAPAAMLTVAAPAHAASTVPRWRNCTYYGNGTHTHNSWFGAHTLRGSIIHSGTCVWQQGARLNTPQNGLTERVRFWSGNNLIRTTWQAGYEASGYTFFQSTPDMFTGTQVCQALVANSNHTRVIYGPVCENT